MNSKTQTQIPFMGYPVGFHVSLFSELSFFSGKPSELSEYIRAVEDTLNQFWQRDNPNAYINKLLFSAARNRLKGAALEIVTGIDSDGKTDMSGIKREA
ncbi:hypothetical protein FQA39_LY17193 [Lamprigera yunnana]|nr:hypothetical protein FQA39_LY17193 [Lamprigera yunnana]